MQKLKFFFKSVKSFADLFILLVAISSIVYGIAPEKIVSEFSPFFSNETLIYIARIVGVLLVAIFLYSRTKPAKASKPLYKSYPTETADMSLLFNFLDSYPFGTDQEQFQHYARYQQITFSYESRNELFEALGRVFRIMNKIVRNDKLKGDLIAFLNLFTKKTLKQDNYSVGHSLFPHTPEVWIAKFENRDEFNKKRKEIRKIVCRIIDSLEKDRVN